MTHEDERISVWDAVIEGRRWYRKATSSGYQYASEPENRRQPLKVFLTARTMGGLLPAALVPVRTGIVFGTQGRDAAEIREAFHVGYRVFDTARSYGNLGAVAQALSDVPRDDYEIVYKLEAEDVSAAAVDDVAAAFQGVLDVVMLHNVAAPEVMKQALAVLSGLQEKGIVRRIGASNVVRDDLETLHRAGVTVVQNDLDRRESGPVYEGARHLGIRFQGYGLGHQVAGAAEIASRFHVSPTALLLAWARRTGIEPVMSSGKPGRRIANADASHEAVPPEAVDALIAGRRPADARPAPSVADLPPPPPAAEAFIQTLMAVIADDAKWPAYRTAFGILKNRLQLLKQVKTVWRQPVPPVSEVPERYHGRAFGELIRQMSTLNDCDRGGFLQAVIAAARNTAAEPVAYEEV